MGYRRGVEKLWRGGPGGAGCALSRGSGGMSDRAEGAAAARPGPKGGAGEVFREFLRLGLTSFGGPVAHLGYFREAFVARKKWMSDAAYADLVALCQFLPGPASSQVGLAIGVMRAGFWGGAAAWAAFTLPSAILMAAFAYGVVAYEGALGGGWLLGLKAAAAAVVAQAIIGMARSLTPDAPRALLAAAGAAIALLAPGVLGQLGAIALGAAVGAMALRAPPAAADARTPLAEAVSPRTGVVCLALFFLLLALLPLLAQSAAGGDPAAARAAAHLDGFYRSGALVFGGGHVVLPLLQAETVAQGYVSEARFLAGYGAAQAVPGPLFSFAAYLGAAMTEAPNAALGAALCLVAIYIPSTLLVVGALPFWDRLRALSGARRLLTGVNAAVVGLLIAAFLDPILFAVVFPFGAADPSIIGPALAVAAFAALQLLKIPPWAVVGLAALAGGGLAATGLA